MSGNRAPAWRAICRKNQPVRVGGGCLRYERLLRQPAKSTAGQFDSRRIIQWLGGGCAERGSRCFPRSHDMAHEEADVALGTDTVGSIRIPAADCGVVGLKTTFGLVPLKGVYPIAPTQLDTVGPRGKGIARTVLGMDLLESGFLNRYHQAVAAKPSAKDIRVGRLYIEGTDPKVDRAVDDALAATGFKVVKLSQEFTDRWNQAQKDAAIVAAVGAWLYDLKFQNESEVTIRTKAVIAVGGLQYKTTYPAALKAQPAWKAEVGKVFRKVDFIAMPTMKTLPPHVPVFGGTVAFEARMLALQNTQAVNFAGNPALAMPVPIAHQSVPASLQLIGPSRSEAA